MRWSKQGVDFRRRPISTSGWPTTPACPSRTRSATSVLRIYFGPRDRQGRTRTAFIDVDADDPSRILRVHDRPVLDLGKPGAFDDSGAMPSCIVNDGGRKYLFYIGWNQGVTVPYRNAVGLAVSDDGGLTFERVFEGPIVDRTRFEPYFCASPFAMIDGGRWRLWYASSTGFSRSKESRSPSIRSSTPNRRTGGSGRGRTSPASSTPSTAKRTPGRA